jgi:hypothetical protein
LTPVNKGGWGFIDELELELEWWECEWDMEEGGTNPLFGSNPASALYLAFSNLGCNCSNVPVSLSFNEILVCVNAVFNGLFFARAASFVVFAFEFELDVDEFARTFGGLGALVGLSSSSSSSSPNGDAPTTPPIALTLNELFRCPPPRPLELPTELCLDRLPCLGGACHRLVPCPLSSSSWSRSTVGSSKMLLKVEEVADGRTCILSGLFFPLLGGTSGARPIDEGRGGTPDVEVEATGDD